MAFSTSSVRRLIVFPVSLHPLKDKNFAPFLFGSILSSIGFWIQSVGQSWQVLQLTNSAFDHATGDLTVRGSFAGVANPSFVVVHPNGHWLYAVSETNQQQEGVSGAVWAFRCR